MIKIMKASAGSGKTFNLAKTYIRLILSQNDPLAYTRVLAVTFTNKATEEMKSRILKELHILSQDPSKSDYYSDFLPICGTEQNLQEKARDILNKILHDYSAFAVSTIDRFFQQALKAFSREIGHFASYQVELDKDSLVNESVDRVLDSLSEDNPNLLRWLTRCALEDLEQGNRYRLEKRLREVAKNLKSDEHRALVEEYGIDEDSVYSKENITRIKTLVTDAINEFHSNVINAAKAFVDGCAECGLQSDSFNRKCFAAIYAVAQSSLKDPIKPPTDAVCKKTEDYPSWFRAADVSANAAFEDKLMPLLEAYCGLFRKGDEISHACRVYNTAVKIKDQLSSLGIAADLKNEFEALLKEKNVLSLDDSNVILRDIIDGSDAPFIYEKLGVRFENFLLDEFQDTSRIQWSNFMPLVNESDSNGHENLLVGDVKQSIYRWRGSDWQLMASEVQKTFPRSEVATLEDNYRSVKNIVEFNNGFFEYAATALDGLDGEDQKDLSISSIYGDVSQNVKAHDEDSGSVEAIFCEEDHELDAIFETVQRVHASGANYGDITILVRDNNHGAEISMFLMGKEINVISDDVLHLKASSVVRQAVSLLSSVGVEDDNIGSFLSKELDVDISDVSYLSLLDLMERIFRILMEKTPDAFKSQTQYIQSFMDYVQDYSSISGNSIDGFLKKWDESDPKIGSPSDPQSVRVMTIHKSKGLEFPYVIVPFSEKTTLFREGEHWARPNVDGTSMEEVSKGIYYVRLNAPKGEKTLFKQGSADEMRLQFIDNINTFYVALTRAVKGMTIISSIPSQECLDAAAMNVAFEPADFSELLYHYLETGRERLGFVKEEVRPEYLVESQEEPVEDVPEEALEETSEISWTAFRNGEMYDFASMERKASDIGERTPGYPSFPLNPETEDASEDVRTRGRLKFSADSVDFFCDEAKANASARMNGTVLHGILSEVVVPSDLPAAVKRAVECGDLDKSKEEETLELLAKRIAAHPGWFPEGGAEVLSEVSLVDVDGREYRPDRVIVKDGKVTVIDYKFGEHENRYRRQVAHYSDIYRKMGHEVAESAIWYVNTDEVE